MIKQIKQQKNLKEIISILQAVSTNSYTLVQATDQQLRSAISYLIELIPQNINNFIIYNLLLNALQVLFPMSNLKQSLIKKTIQKNICQFYDNLVNSSSLFSTVSILRLLYSCKVEIDKQPKNMLVFNGKRGIELLSHSDKALTWQFNQGIAFCCWIYLDNIKFGNQAPLPKLFTVYSTNNGGLQSYLIDNKLYYRILGSKYTEPHIGSNGVSLGQIQPKKWHFICIEHEGGKSFSKSKLNFYLNRNKALSFSVDPPRLTSSQKTKYIFFDNIYCKISTFCIFPNVIGQTKVQELNRNINSIDLLRINKVFIFQQKQGKIYQRSGFGYSPNYILQRTKQMNFKNIFPLFYFLRFIQQNKYPLLQQLLSIFVIFLRSSSQNQQQAAHNHYLKIISQLIGDSSKNIFDTGTIKILLHIKHTITDQVLLDQYFSEFLWPLIPTTKASCQQEILEIIKSNYTLNIGHFSTLIGLDQLFNALLDLQIKSFTCCQKHYCIAMRKLESGDQITEIGKFQTSSNYLLALIELYFQNSRINYPEEAYKLCRMLTLKLSPCLTLSLINLLKKVVSQKLNEKLSQYEAKKILKYFAENKVYLIFLHVIENNIFTEIKAEAAKFIYSFLFIKTNQSQQIELTQWISRSLSVNELIQPGSPVKQVIKVDKVTSISPKSQFSHVGPQAPLISNKAKGNKKFDFGFKSQNKEQTNSQKNNNDKKEIKDIRKETQIMEEEKTMETQIPTQENNQTFRKRNIGLSINTQAINQMYTFGGQKGKQIIISEQQQQNQLNKIKNLAKRCVAYMQGETYKVEQPKFRPIAPLPSTRNKPQTISKQKDLKLKLISQADEDQVYQELSERQSKPSNVVINDQESLCLLYTSLLECALGITTGSSKNNGSKIIVPSVMNIFFSWIPQTDLQVKFLNDLEFIVPDNIQLFVDIPQFYDFLLELCYKALAYQEMGEKRLYVDKLENLIKSVYSYVFQQDPQAISKFSFIIDWSASKGSQYHPKSLFFTCRYAMLLILQAIEQYLIMNNHNDKIMERNFQSLGSVIEGFIYFKPSEINGLVIDNFDRVIFTQEFDIIPSLTPYFKSRWADCLICEKYLFLFRRFFCTEWYLKGLRLGQQITEDWLRGTMEEQTNQLIKQGNYYLKNNFLISLIEIQRALVIEVGKISVTGNQENIKQLVWQLRALIMLSEIYKDKIFTQHRSQVMRTFLKSCKILADLKLSQCCLLPKFVSKLNDIIINRPMDKAQIHSNRLVEDILKNYIPEYIAQENVDIDTLKVAFNQLWLPSESTHRKIHSQLYKKYSQKYSNINKIEIAFIDNISTIMEEQKQRRKSTSLLLDINVRNTRNLFRKIWKDLRIYGTLWTHPQFSWQNDALCNKSMFSYEKYKPSPFYKLKISKHLSKYKARFFTKPRLIQPTIAQQKYNEDVTQPEELFLDRALYASQKLSLGKSLLSWLCRNQSMEILMEFKKARIINTLTVRHGHIGIINDSIVFLTSTIKQKQSHLAIMEYQLLKNKSYVKQWPLELIKQINKRRFMNKPRAIQVTLIHGKSVFLDFSQQDAQQFCKKIFKLKSRCPNLINSKTLEIKKIYENQALLKKWASYQLTNFDYLMELNHLAGRSYSDVTQFPVFPWVLVNFGNKLILSDPSNYRNLSLPMGALGSPERTHVFAQRYQMMTVQQKGANKFHYGTHYSSPGIIYHFLIRLSPFTQGSILLQGGKFDFADRLFFSIADSYKNSTSEYSDVRQLVPEMYTIPQVYLNLNKNDFGIMQNKKRVNNVELPEWAKQNPYLYITKLRKSLQQNYVSSNIHNWIDLIFGYKQRGEEAIKNLNCFYYLTYEDLNFQQVQSQKMMKALESQILNFGQTPSQILTKPHPQRNHLSTIQDYYTLCDPNSQLKVYRPSKGKNISGTQLQMNPIHQIGDSIIHMKWVKDSKLVFLRRNGELIVYKWHVSPGNSKVPFQCAIEKEKKIQRIQKLAFDPNEHYDLSLKTQSFPVEFINFEHVIALGGLNEGKLVLIDTDSNHIIETYQAHTETISCMLADSKQNFLITGDVQGHVVLWRINNNKIILYQHYKDQSGQITSFFISYQLKCFAVSSTDGSVILYNIITGKKIRIYYHPKRLPIDQILITTNPLAAIIIFSNSQSIIYCYSINGQLIQRVHEKDMQYFLSPTIIKDSYGFEYITYGNQHGEVIFRTLPFLDDPKKYTVAKDASVNRVCISKNHRFLVSGCSDGQLSVITDPNPIVK